MRIRLIDTYEQIRRLRERSQPLSPETYRSYAEGVSPALYEKCLRDSASYDFTSQILPVLEDALFRRFDRVAAAHQALEEIAAFVPARAGELFADDFEASAVFYLGLCNGAGWATELEGKPAVLLGAEKIAELGWHDRDSMADLVCHETAHLFHSSLRKGMPPPPDSLRALYEEGFAVRVSQRLYREGCYAQNRGGWLSFCTENREAIRREFRDRLRSGNDTACFFGDWNTVMGFSDLGYFLGCEWMRQLEKRYSLREIALFDAETIEREALGFLYQEK